MPQSTGSFAACIASASIATSSFSTSFNATKIGTAIATEDLYPLLDFQLIVTAGTVSAGDIFNLYRRRSDGTTQQPIPTATNQRKFVKTFTIDSNSETVYEDGVPNIDPEDEYYLENTGAASITVQLKVRGRDYT